LQPFQERGNNRQERENNRQNAANALPPVCHAGETPKKRTAVPDAAPPFAVSTSTQAARKGGRSRAKGQPKAGLMKPDVMKNRLF
jgi:hypothetical protein